MQIYGSATFHKLVQPYRGKSSHRANDQTERQAFYRLNERNPC